MEVLVNKSLNVRWHRVVFRNEVRQLVDSDDRFFSLDFFPEIGECIVPSVDPRNTVVEVFRNPCNELLVLSFFSFLCSQEVNVRLLGAKLFNEFRLSDPAASIDDEERVPGRLER